MDVEHWLRGAWELVPRNARAASYPALQRLYSSGASLLDVRALLEPLSVLRTTAALRRDAGTTLGLVIAGTARDVSAIARHVLGSVPTQPLGHEPAWRLGSLVADGLRTADVVLVAVPEVLRPWMPRSLVIAPGSVAVRLSVETGLRAWHAARQPLGAYVRKVRRLGLGLEVRRGPETVRRFHADFYGPYAASRDGDRAVRHRLALYRQHLRRIEVLWTLERGREIAAYLAIDHDDRYRFLDVGYRDGDRKLVERGVGHALYAAALWRAAELGHDVIDHGPERPFLASSHLDYKLQWGAHLEPDPWSTRILGVGFREPNGAAARRFLEACPLVVRDDERLVGLVEPGCARLGTLERRFAGAGLAGFVPP